MAKPYDQINERRAIIRRRALEEALAKLVEDLPTGNEPPRPQVLALLRDALAAGRAEIRRRFEGPGPLRNDGPAVLVATSFLMDQLIRVIFDLADGRLYPAANPSAAERLSVVATGGFGRGEMAPLSDIDLLFLRPYKQTPRGEQIVEFMLYLLWDLGLKVGHATRTVDESAALRRARPHHPHRAPRGALHLGRSRAVRRADESLRPEIHLGRRARFRRGQAHRARPAPPAHGRLALRRGAQRQGRQGRPARPAHAVLDRQVSLSRRPAERTDRQGRADQGGSAPLRARRPLPQHRALPHPLSDRPRRRSPVVRPAARDRHAPRLPGPAGQPRRRALHEALLPSCQDRRRPDAHLRRRARGQPPAQAQARGTLANPATALAQWLPHRWRAAGGRHTRRLREGSGGDPAPVPCRAGERPRHPSRDACG